jgi:hypothetical protein
MLNVHETMIHSKTSPVQNHIKQSSTMDNWSHCIVFDKAQDRSNINASINVHQCIEKNSFDLNGFHLVSGVVIFC